MAENPNRLSQFICILQAYWLELSHIVVYFLHKYIYRKYYQNTKLFHSCNLRTLFYIAKIKLTRKWDIFRISHVSMYYRVSSPDEL